MGTLGKWLYIMPLLIGAQVVALYASIPRVVQPRISVKSPPVYVLQLRDPDNSLRGQQKIFEENLQAAMEAWANVVEIKTPLIIDVEMVKAGEGRLDGASLTTHLLETENGYEIYEEGAAYKIRTGQSAQPGQADIHIRINPEYLRKEVWMDPHADQQVDPVPAHKLDLVSLLMHEIGHAIGFHSFRDLKTGQLPAKYMSALDHLMQYQNDGYFFTGSEAVLAYGHPVPMTSTIQSQNYSHYGNLGNPELLTWGLMSGVTFQYSRRYKIGDIDRAILEDLGLPIRTHLTLANAN